MIIIGEKETISFTYFLHQFSWQPSKEYINFCLDLLINHGWNLFTNMGCSSLCLGRGRGNYSTQAHGLFIYHGRE